MSEFSDIKVGDVFFSRSGWARRLLRKTVTHVTATQFHSESAKYRKADGYCIGSSRGWDSRAIVATEEIVTAYNSEKAEDKARAAIAVAISILERARGEDAIRIAALLPAELTEKKDG